MESVKEYIDFMFNKLNELSIEDISYSDYDQMTDWLAEIKRQVKKLEKKQEPMKPEADGEFGLCKRCGYVFNSELISEYCVKYCPNCGQAIDWED